MTISSSTHHDTESGTTLQEDGKRGAQSGGENARGGGDDKPEQKKKKLNPVARLIIGIILVVLVIFAVIAGIRYLSYASTHQTTDDAQVDADIVAVTSKISERVDRILVDTNQYVKRGQVVVRLDDHDERQRYDQALANFNAVRAQAVAASQNVGLTVDEQRAQITQGNGSVAQAQASIENARQQARQAQDQIRVAQADLAAAKAQLHAAEAVVPGLESTERRDLADLARQTSLVRTGDAAQSSLDAATAAEATARSNRDQAMANVRAEQGNVQAAFEKLQSTRSASGAAVATVALQDATLTQAQGKLDESSSPFRVSSQRSQADASAAQVATAKAQLAQARDQLSYTVIKASEDGYIGEKDVEAGRTVSPGQTLLTLIPTNHVYVTANFKETQIGEMRAGQTVDVHVDAYPHHDFVGKLSAIGPASQATYSLVPAQNATGNFVKITQRIPVRIVVDQGVDKDHPLRVGMSVEASVDTK